MAELPPTVSILIVSYNTRDMTIACLRSIMDQARDETFEVIVVDNTSTDGSADEIERQFSDVTLIRSPHNLGFARANNLAAVHAKGEYILLLNPDTVVLDRAVDRIVEFARSHPDARIWGGRTVFEDGSLNPTSCWAYMTLWSLSCQATGLSTMLPGSTLSNPEAYGGWNRDSVREVDIVTGCFLLADRKMWNCLDGFDRDFFMYAEEADLCYRAHKKGAQPKFTPAATIIHYGGASEVVLCEKVKKLFCGQITFLNKHWPTPKRGLGVNLIKLYALVRMFGYFAATLLTRSERHKAASREWRNVWLERNQWMHGYPSQTE